MNKRLLINLGCSSSKGPHWELSQYFIGYRAKNKIWQEISCFFQSSGVNKKIQARTEGKTSVPLRGSCHRLISDKHPPTFYMGLLLPWAQRTKTGSKIFPYLATAHARLIFHVKFRADVNTLQLSTQWTGLWMAARLEVTLLWYRPFWFCCVNAPS